MKQFLQFLKITLALVLFLQSGRVSAQSCSTLVNDNFGGSYTAWTGGSIWTQQGLLQFTTDGYANITASRYVTIPANVTVTLTNVAWKNTSVNNSSGNAKLYFKIAGTTYLIIDTKNYDSDSPSIAAYNGATITNGAANLPAGGGINNVGNLSSYTTIVFTIPNSAISNALLEFNFLGGGDGNNVDDLFIGAITVNATQPPTPSLFSKVDPVCGTSTGTVNLNTATPQPLYSMDLGAWQTSATFSGLAAGSTHTFRTAYSGSTGCASSSLSVTIGAAVANRTVTAASSSPNVCIGTPITNITHTTTGVTGIGTGATGLPAGLTATYASNVVTISGTPNATVIPGSYTYTIPLVGCGTANATGTITVNAKPVANAGADFSITCTTNPTGAAIGATAVTGVTYSWTASTGTAPTGANPTVNPTATTTYTLTTTNTASGCTATDTVVVTVDTAAPAAPLLSGTTIANVCDNNFVNLNSLVSNGTTNLKWYTDSAHTSEVADPTAVTTSGTYYPYNVGSSNGCFSSAASSSVTATVTVCCKATIAPNLNN